MTKQDIYFLIFIIVIVALLVGSGIIYYSEKSEIPEISAPGKEYSFKDVIYNFWGFVKVKEEDTVSVEGIIPTPGQITVNQPLQTIKFKITASTKIVKLEKVGKELKQVFVDSEIIQIKDNLALKADEINLIKKEAIATDILILPPLPSPLPLPSQGTTTPVVFSPTTSQ